MKNLVRAFVFALVATGIYASAQMSTSGPALHAKVSALPIPSCPPDDPDGCGICNLNGCGPDKPK